MKIELPTIIIDKREKLPYDFQSIGSVPFVMGTLKTGDYSLEGFVEGPNNVAVERKTLNDFVACCMGDNRKRFESEICRAEESIKHFMVVIESDIKHIKVGKYTSKIKPHSVCQTILSFMIRYNVPFFLSSNRRHGEYITYWFLQKHYREYLASHEENKGEE